MKLTTQEEIYLRQQPHRTKLWLSIYQPKTVFQTQLASGTFQFGETEIDYTGDITGSWLSTYPNMTVLVGTQPGSDDVGRVRLRSATGTYVVVAENNMIWEQNQYLTFIDYINIEAIFPKIIKDPNSAENVIFYKDDDIAYSNQNSIYGTFPCMGSHRAAFIETGSVNVYWTATGTYSVKSDSLTYNWAFEGGTPTGSTALTPGNVSYSTPGHYKTRLIVTSSSGAQDVSYRYVSLYQKPDAGTSTPILKWELKDLAGSRGEGGYTATIRSWENLSSIEPNALVVLFAEDSYGSTNVSLGGNAQNEQKIVFVGYILKDSIEFNYKDGWAEFQIGSPTEVMKESEGFAVSCESKASPSTWYQLHEMTVPKAIYHYLRWHSTVLNVTDFQYTGDDRLVQYFDTDRSSVFDAINTFVSEGLFGELVSDRQGKLWAEISPIGYENPITNISQGMTILKQDWVGTPNISKRRTSQVSFVEMGGIVFEGVSTNGFQALLSNAPSITPLYRGKADSPREGLILNNQTQLNKITGNYLAHVNSKYEDVSLNLAGNYRNFDIAPQERLYLMIDGSETPSGDSLVGYPFRLTSMDWNYSPKNESFYPDITLEQIATGTAGQTVIIPPVLDDVGYSYPSLELPPFPDFNTGVEPPTQQDTQYMLGLELNNNTPFYTLNFDQQYPEWIPWRYGIDSTDYVYNPNTGGANMNYVLVAPNGAVWIVAYKLLSSTYYAKKIYRAPYLGGKFEKIIDENWLIAEYGEDNIYRVIQINGFGYKVDEPETIAFSVSHQNFNDTSQVWIGNSSGWTKGVAFGFTGNVGKITGSQDQWVSSWYRSNNEGFFVFDAGGTRTKTLSYGQGVYNEIVRAGDTKTVLKYKALVTGDEGLLRSEDNCENVTIITLPEAMYGLVNNIATDPTGQYLMANYKNGVYRGRSYDGGYTWSVLTGLVPVGADNNFAYCGGEAGSSKWVTGQGAIYYTNNFGSSWSDKTGNLLQVFLPPTGAQVLRFVPYLLQATV